PERRGDGGPAGAGSGVVLVPARARGAHAGGAGVAGGGAGPVRLRGGPGAALRVASGGGGTSFAPGRLRRGAALAGGVPRRVLGGDWRAAYPLNSLGVLALAEGDAATARTLLEERLPELRATGPRWLLGHVLVNLGAAALELDDPDQARAHFAEGLRLFRELASLDGAAMGLAGLARLAAAQGQAERAGRLFSGAAALCPAGGRLLGITDWAAFD